MFSLKAIISYGTRCGKACVHDGGPTLETMMMIAVKQVRDSNGHSRTGCFDGGEGGVIVDDVVGQKCFVAATTAKVQGRRVVQCPRSSDGSKQETVLAIPEAMFGRRQFCIDVAAA